MTSNSGVRSFGDVRVDVAAERVWRAGELVDLEPKAFGVLGYLLAHPGRLVSKQELLDAVWSGTAVTDNALTRVVAQLRRAIGDDARDARYIETVPTRGYRFIAEVREEGIAPDVSPVSTQNISGPPPVGLVEPRRGFPSALAGGIAVALIVIVGIAWWMRSSASRAQADAIAGDASGSSRIAGTKDARAVLDASWITQATFSIDLDAFPSFSPDGTALAYGSVRRGNLDLFVKSFAPGAQERQVTNDGQQNVQPDWSPDGQVLAYHSLARGGIWTVPASGGSMRQIADVGSAPRWSPDGQWLLYQSGEVHSLDRPSLDSSATLWLAAAHGDSRRQLTRPGRPIGGHSEPSWSADGRRVVFIVRHPGPVEIWSVDVADGALTRLIACEGVCGSPVLDIDGRGLFYSTGEPQRGIWRVPLSADGRATAGDPVLLYAPIESDVSGLTLRRDEPRLAFGLTTTRSNLEGITIDARPTPRASAPQPVTQDTSSRNMWPAISPDGSRLAYISRRTGNGHHVWVAAADGSDAHQLTQSNPVAVGLQGWLPNGDEIACVTLVDRRRLALVAASVTTGRTRELHGFPPVSEIIRAQVMYPRLLPDGTAFVFARVADGVANLWLQSLDSITTADASAARQLTHDAEAAVYAAISRDGRWIAYEALRGGDMQLGIVSRDGGEPRLLTSGRGLTWPHSFAPDHDRIAVAYRRDGLWRIGFISRTTGQLVPLTAPAPANAFVRYPEWSPRGDRIVYEHAKTTGNIWLARLPSSTGGWSAGTRE